jgi:hypothetical protein
MLDSGVLASRDTVGKLGVEFQNGGRNAAIPKQPWSFVGDVFAEFVVYGTGAGVAHVVCGNNSNFNDSIVVTDTTVEWRVFNVTTAFTAGTDPRGKLCRVTRTGATATLHIDGVLADTQAINTDNFSPTRVGDRGQGTNTTTQLTYLNFNGEAAYVFKDRGGTKVTDKIGKKDLTLTDEGGGLPEWVYANNLDPFATDDGTVVVGGSVDMFWMNRQDFETTMALVGDDVYTGSTLLDTLKQTFNGVTLTPDYNTTRNDWIMIEFMTDGNGLGYIAIGTATAEPVLYGFGNIGSALTTAVTMLYGNDPVLGNGLDGYLYGPIHYGRQIGAAGVTAYWEASLNAISTYIVLNQ